MKTPRHPHAGHPREMFHHHPEPGFGPDGEGRGRGRRGHGPGPGARGPRGRRGRGGRMSRGDVRTAVLLLLAEEPMHGYQLMQAIAERTGGRWTPSPGAIYPALSLLEDEGLVAVTADSGRKVATLTEAGRALVEAERDGWSDPFADATDGERGPDLRALVMQLVEATRTVGRTGSPAQVTAAAAILGEARRAMYLLLADGPAPETGTAAEADS